MHNEWLNFLVMWLCPMIKEFNFSGMSTVASYFSPTWSWSWGTPVPLKLTGSELLPGSAWSARPVLGWLPVSAEHSGGSQSYRLPCKGLGLLEDPYCPFCPLEPEWCLPPHLLLLHSWSWSPVLCCCWPALSPDCEPPPALRENIERFLCCATIIHTHTRTHKKTHK